VVALSVYQEIQTCKRHVGNKKKTAERLNLARGTVRKFWSMSAAEYDAYCRRASKRRHRFDSFRAEIITLIEMNEADGEQVHGSSIYDVLEERHGQLPASERTLRNYIRELRETGAVDTTMKKPVRRPQSESTPGDQCQVDFGQRRIAGGIIVYIYAAVLAASRVRYIAVQDHPFRTVEVIRHTLDAFRYFGGRPKTLVIDQDKLMTVSENAGEIRHTTDFEHFIREQDLAVWLCRKADPESKGKVENTVKFVKTSFFSARQFMTIEDIYEPLLRWLTRRANGKIHQATGRIPSRVLDIEERPALRALRSSVYDQLPGRLGDTRKADEKGMISFRGNLFSVPDDYAGMVVAVQASPSHLRIHDVDTGKELVVHRLPESKGQTIVAAAHRRQRMQNARTAYTELSERLSFPAWKMFLEANQETYRRYWKEQSGILNRFIDTVAEMDILKSAVMFCNETGCCGATDLKLAYEHLWESQQSDLPPLLEHAKPMISLRTGQAPKVAKRGVRYYMSALSLVLGVSA